MEDQHIISLGSASASALHQLLRDNLLIIGVVVFFVLFISPFIRHDKKLHSQVTRDLVVDLHFLTYFCVHLTIW